METTTWVGVVTALVTGVGIPLLVMMQSFGKTARHEQFQAVHKRLDHLDSCIDDVRGIVYSKGVTREDLVSFKADTTEILNRMRLAISGETARLDSRIMRLEDPHFRKDGDC
jgi:uncharacterized membrane-anchored protein YhcB (DUF1043 family)